MLAADSSAKVALHKPSGIKESHAKVALHSPMVTLVSAAGSSRRRRRAASLDVQNMKRMINDLKTQVSKLSNNTGDVQERTRALEGRVLGLEKAMTDEVGIKRAGNITVSLDLVRDGISVLEAMRVEDVETTRVSQAVEGLFRAFNLVFVKIPEELHAIVDSTPRLNELAQRGGLPVSVIEQDKMRHPTIEYIEKAVKNWGFDTSIGIATGKAVHRPGPPSPQEALEVARADLVKASEFLSTLEQKAIKLRTFVPPPWPDETACSGKLQGQLCSYRAERACPPVWLEKNCARTPESEANRQGKCRSSTSFAGLRCISVN